MDTSVFLLKRAQIQLRMEDRRRMASAGSHSSGILGWAVKGAGWVARLASNGSGGLLRSLIWAVIAPAFVGAMRRGGDSIVHKLIRAIFPSR